MALVVLALLLLALLLAILISLAILLTILLTLAVLLAILASLAVLLAVLTILICLAVLLAALTILLTLAILVALTVLALAILVALALLLLALLLALLLLLLGLLLILVVARVSSSSRLALVENRLQSSSIAAFLDLASSGALNGGQLLRLLLEMADDLGSALALVLGSRDLRLKESGLSTLWNLTIVGGGLSSLLLANCLVDLIKDLLRVVGGSRASVVVVGRHLQSERVVESLKRREKR